MTDRDGFAGQIEPTVDLTVLPEIESVTVREVTFADERVEYEGLEPVRHRSAIAFDVTTSEPFVTRALGPAVFVGETAFPTFDRIAANQYRFYAFDTEQLEQGAPITVGWVDTEPEQRVTTAKRYEGPTEPPEMVEQD